MDRQVGHGSFKLRTLPLLLVVALVASMLLPVAAPVEAATFTVNQTGDAADANAADGVCDVDPATPGNQCTFRAALQAADALAGVDTINVPAGLYLITLGPMFIGQSVTIVGTGAPDVRANGNFNLLYISPGAVVSITNVQFTRTSGTTGAGITTSANVTLTNVTVSGHRDLQFSGAGLSNNGTLNLIDSLVTDNRAPSSGGILNWSNGTLSLLRTTVTGNVATDDAGGIGINSTSGPVTITDSIIMGNAVQAGVLGNDVDAELAVPTTQAGGIGIGGGTVSIMNTTIQSNSVIAGEAGGIGVSGGTVTITNSRVTGNIVSTDAGGIGIQGGSVSINTSTISGNQARDAAGLGVRGGSLTVTNSTISGNTADRDAGGIGVGTGAGVVTVTNSTISGNSATSRAGGIGNAQQITVLNSTITANAAPQGGGVSGLVGSTMNLKNTIVANSTGGGGNCFGSFTSQGNNLSSDNSCLFAQPGDVNNTNPLLGPLADNGGPTLTHRPSAGSPALDAGTNTGCPAQDQRGQVRPRDGNGDGTATCDIGAVEVQAAELATATATATPTRTATATGTATRTPTVTATATNTPTRTATPAVDPRDWVVFFAQTPGGGFGSGVALPAVGISHVRVAAGDVTGDGILDIVVAGTGGGSPGSLAVYRGLGDGTFEAPSLRALAGAPQALALSDVDQDGRRDIAVAEANPHQIEFFSNGSLAAPSLVVPLTQAPTSLAVGRLTEDVAPDLAVGPSGPTSVRVLRNVPSQPTQDDACSVGGSARAMFFNRSELPSGGGSDQDLDLFVLTGTGIAVRENPGAGAAFCGGTAGEITLPISGDPVDMVTADVVSNQRADLIVLNRGTNQLSTYLSQGSSPYSVPIDTAIAANGQGLAPFYFIPGSAVSVAVVHGPSSGVGASGGTNGRLAILTGDGSGSFTPYQTIPLDCGGRPSIAAGDFTRDGRADFVVTGCSPVPSSVTPTATPTPRVGGRGLTVVGAQGATPVNLRWRDGVAQTGYLVIRWNATTGQFEFLPRFDQLLTAHVTQFTDNGPLPSDTYCYVLLIVQDNPPSINGVLGISDLLCVYPHDDTGNPPPSFGVRIDEGNIARLTWSPAAGHNHYQLIVTRFDGSGPETLTLGSQVTSFDLQTGGATTCFQLRPRQGTNEIGRSDTICAAPGVASIPASGLPAARVLDQLRSALPRSGAR